MTLTKVDILIATYRRPAMLRDSVLSLLGMKIPSDVSLRVLIIDNDPERSASHLMQELAERCANRFALRYISEPQVGLSYARNRGIDEAQGDVIALLDDDIYASEDWLTVMLECLWRNNADAVGGRMVSHWESQPDATVIACESSLVAQDLGDRDYALRGRMAPSGGNCLFRRQVFDAGLRFSTELGRIGETLLSGEDTELFTRLQMQGRVVWYSARGVLHHRIGGERLTQDYLTRRSFWFGYSYAIIDRRVRGRRAQIGTAVARLGKLLSLDIGHLVLASLLRNSAGRLVARCSIAKQWGYLRATLLPLSIVGARELRSPVSAAGAELLP
jgi:glycosyltransferase involved in cell wall biosynthesis